MSFWADRVDSREERTGGEARFRFFGDAGLRTLGLSGWLAGFVDGACSPRDNNKASLALFVSPYKTYSPPSGVCLRRSLYILDPLLFIRQVYGHRVGVRQLSRKARKLIIQQSSPVCAPSYRSSRASTFRNLTRFSFYTVSDSASTSRHLSSSQYYRADRKVQCRKDLASYQSTQELDSIHPVSITYRDVLTGAPHFHFLDVTGMSARPPSRRRQDSKLAKANPKPRTFEPLLWNQGQMTILYMLIRRNSRTRLKLRPRRHSQIMGIPSSFRVSLTPCGVNYEWVVLVPLGPQNSRRGGDDMQRPGYIVTHGLTSQRPVLLMVEQMTCIKGLGGTSLTGTRHPKLTFC